MKRWWRKMSVRMKTSHCVAKWMTSSRRWRTTLWRCAKTEAEWHTMTQKKMLCICQSKKTLSNIATMCRRCCAKWWVLQDINSDWQGKAWWWRMALHHLRMPWSKRNWWWNWLRVSRWWKWEWRQRFPMRTWDWWTTGTASWRKIHVW